MIQILLRVLLVCVLVFLILRVARGLRAGGGRDFKCRTCRHCRRLGEDGATCTFGDRETFKNPTHIANCLDYEKRR